jgi:hypothetical protein
MAKHKVGVHGALFISGLVEMEVDDENGDVQVSLSPGHGQCHRNMMVIGGQGLELDANGLTALKDAASQLLLDETLISINKQIIKATKESAAPMLQPEAKA